VYCDLWVFYDHRGTKEKKETTATNIGYAQLLAFEYIWYADFLFSICLGRQILLRKSANASIAAR